MIQWKDEYVPGGRGCPDLHQEVTFQNLILNQKDNYLDTILGY